jgi:hypothetical protein
MASLFLSWLISNGVAAAISGLVSAEAAALVQFGLFVLMGASFARYLLKNFDTPD